ncbi:MAG: hypothetical protein ACRBB3_06225 [Alphaproteobacteria bacterium]
MAKDIGLLMDKAIHYSVLMFTLALIVFGAFFAYNAIVNTNEKTLVDKTEINENENQKGAAKQLPDFIVDKIKPDELGQLKP